MIILRTGLFSQKTDEETQRQKKDRKRLATTSGILAGGLSGAIIGSGIESKVNKDRAKVIDKATERLNKIDREARKVEEKITSKANEILKDPRIKREGNLGRIKVEIAANELLKKNAELTLNKMENLDAAKKRLLKRIQRKGLKAHGIGALGALGVGTLTGLAANNSLKKHNKKVNRIRRHIED